MRTFGTKVVEDDVTFDSKLEHKIYKHLKRFFAKDEIWVHYPFELSYKANVESIVLPLELENLEQSQQNINYYSKLLKPVIWKVDFYIPTAGLFVEAKGRWMPVDRFKVLGLIPCLIATENVFRVVSPNKPSKSWFDENAEAYDDIFWSLKDFTKASDNSYDTEDFLVALGAL